MVCLASRVIGVMHCVSMMCNVPFLCAGALRRSINGEAE
jgi:hypothetical protein